MRPALQQMKLHTVHCIKHKDDPAHEAWYKGFSMKTQCLASVKLVLVSVWFACITATAAHAQAPSQETGQNQAPPDANGDAQIPVPDSSQKPCDCSKNTEPFVYRAHPWAIQPKEGETLPVGRVVKAASGKAIVNLGTRDGLRYGDTITFYTRPDEIISAGRVVSLKDTESEIELGVNERVRSGWFAAKVDAPMVYDTINPPRVSGIWELKFATRAILTVEKLGVGSLSDASIGYRGKLPYFFRLAMDPSGAAFNSEKTIGTFSGHAWLGYDNQAIEVGLGAGYSTVNRRYLTEDIQAQKTTGSGFSFGQTLRLGALDGAHLNVETSFVLFQKAWRFGTFAGALQIPFNYNTWIVLRGGGSIAGYYFGEVAVRRLVYGNGDHGSLFVVPSIGGAQVYKEGDTDFVNVTYDYAYSGPMIGCGIEYRL